MLNILKLKTKPVKPSTVVLSIEESISTTGNAKHNPPANKE